MTVGELKSELSKYHDDYNIVLNLDLNELANGLILHNVELVKVKKYNFGYTEDSRGHEVVNLRT